MQEMELKNYGVRGLRQVQWHDVRIDARIIGLNKFRGMVGFPIYIIKLGDDGAEYWDIMLALEGLTVCTSRGKKMSLEDYTRKWVAYSIDL